MDTFHLQGRARMPDGPGQTENSQEGGRMIWKNWCGWMLAQLGVTQPDS